MALTADQRVEFDRYVQGMIGTFTAGGRGSSGPMVNWFTATELERLSLFKAWATTERTREAQAEINTDERVIRDKISRAARDKTLAEIDSLASL